MFAAACLTLAGVHFLVWLRARDSRSHLLFVACAVAMAALAGFELALLRAQTVGHYGEVLRWMQVPVWALVVSLVWLVRQHLHSGRPWLVWAVCGLRTLALVLNFLFTPNLHFREIASLRPVSLWGEPVSIPVGTVNPWSLIDQLSLLLFLIFVVDAAVGAWRRGQGRRAAVIVGALGVGTLILTGQSALLVWGLLESPHLLNLAFLGILLVMGLELSRDVLRAASLSRELRASEERLRQGVRVAGLGLFEQVHGTDELQFSPRVRELCGWTEEKTIRLDKAIQSVAPTDRPALDAAILRALDPDGDGTLSFELRIVRPDGSIRRVSARGQTSFEGEGADRHPVRSIGALVDITDITESTARKQAERALRENEERLRLTLDATAMGTFEFNPVTGKTHWNSVEFGLLGLKPDGAAAGSETFFRFVHPDDVGAVRRLWEEALRTGHLDTEFRMVRADGEVRWLAGKGRFGSKGTVDGVVPFLGVNYDITERKQAAALRENEQKYRALFEVSHDAIMTLEPPSWRFTSGNPACVKMFGAWNEEGFLSEAPRDLSPPQQPDGRESSDKAREMIETALREGSHYFEWTHRRLNGQEFLATVLLSRMQADGKVFLQATVRDIAVRKRAEMARRESEERYRLLADHAEDFVALHDTEGNRLYVSPSFYRRTGWTIEDVQATDWRARRHPDELALIERVRAANLAGQSTNIEHRIHCKDGSWIWVESRCKPLTDAEGKVWRLVLWSHDITGRKQAEAARGESEQRFRSIYQHAATGIAMNELDGRFVQCNAAFCQITGYSEQELCAMQFPSLIHPEDRTENMKAAARLLNEEIQSFEIENRYVRKNGEPVWVHKFISLLRDERGRATHMVALVTDITERKHAEAALRESEERFRQVTGAIDQVFWMTSADKLQVLYISPAYEHIWGRTCQSLYDSPRAWIEAVHPEDRPRLIQSATTRQASGEYDVEYRIIRPDGSERWIHDRAFPIPDASGAVRRIAGVAEDITERRRLESELLEVTDREQQRLGHDLHDGLGQELTALEMKSVLLLDDLAAEDLTARRGAFQEQTRQIGQRLRECITLTRTLAQGLAPVVLAEEGLVGALEQLARRNQIPGRIECRFLCRADVPPVPSPTAAHLYRIAQEAVSNALKHGQPRRISITVAHENDTLRLRVHDDGRGLASVGNPGSGMGLHVMRHRASAIGASLEIESQPGQGVNVLCLLPLPTKPS